MLLCSGCAASRSSFVSEANETCSRYAQRIDDKTLPSTPQQGIQYAIGYYTELDLAVSTLRGLRLPSHDARDLRTRWLIPAQRSLAGFQPQLQTIRTASLAGDGAQVDALLARLRGVGGAGVDGAYLDSLGLTSCHTLFAST